MTDYPATILTPSASDAERAIDRANASTLAAIPVNIVRWVKNPDLCPLELLPWLAWEFQVDTWNSDWTEREKRDAIKRAPYIHRHRGTPSAVKRALVDSPFGTQIVEWFEQTPKGNPYTFRLNVFQDDLPVTEYDHQDLKHAVMRAKNLRSWFSVHIFGRLTGQSYSAGYMFGSEKIRPRQSATSIILSDQIIYLAPGESKTVTVTVLPPNAEDKTVTLSTTDNTYATVQQQGNKFTFTGKKRGACSYTVTTANGITATITVNVVSVTKFVSRIDSQDDALFFVSGTMQPFTVDYGDGIDSTDYIFKPKDNGVAVIPTRQLNVGEKYTITVKNADSLSFYIIQTPHDEKINVSPLVELISVGSDRKTMRQFAMMCSELEKINPGALDLSYATDFTQAFCGNVMLKTIPSDLFHKCPCMVIADSVLSGAFALIRLPEKLFVNCHDVTTFAGAFYSCRSLETIPDDLFSYSPLVTSFAQVFQGCYNLTQIPEKLFSASLAATTFYYAFNACRSLVSVPDGLFSGLENVTSFGRCFNNCAALISVGDNVFKNCINARDMSFTFAENGKLKAVGTNIFAGCSGVTSFMGVFVNCPALEKLPSFNDCRSCVSLHQAFYGCRALTVVDDGAFSTMELLTSANYAFQYCTKLETVNGIFRNCVSLTNVDYTFFGAGIQYISGVFDGCIKLATLKYTFSESSLIELGVDVFAGCSAITEFYFTFDKCNQLKKIPSGLFNDCVAVTSFLATFIRCAALEDVPTGLFDCNHKVLSFNSTFTSCSSLAKIPSGLFENKKLVTTFSSVFSSTAIQLVPDDTFSGCVSVTEFANAFYYCGNLLSVSGDLLRDCAKITSLDSAFMFCTKLSSIDGVFLERQRQLVNAADMFYGCYSLKCDVGNIMSATDYPDITSTYRMFYHCRELTGYGLPVIEKINPTARVDKIFGFCEKLNDYELLPEAYKQ